MRYEPLARRERVHGPQCLFTKFSSGYRYARILATCYYTRSPYCCVATRPSQTFAKVYKSWAARSAAKFRESWGRGARKSASSAEGRRLAAPHNTASAPQAAQAPEAFCAPVGKLGGRAPSVRVGWASHQEMLWLRLAPRLARAARPLARFAVPATAIGVASLAKPASCWPFGDEIDATMRELLDETRPRRGRAAAPTPRRSARRRRQRRQPSSSPRHRHVRPVGRGEVVGVGAGPSLTTEDADEGPSTSCGASPPSSSTTCSTG